jgi:hypothetical protein
MTRENLKNQVNSKIVNDELSEEEMMHDIMQMVDAHVTQQLILSDVGSSGSEFEKDLFKLINNYCENGLKKPELVKKMEWVLGSCKMS